MSSIQIRAHAPVQQIALAAAQDEIAAEHDGQRRADGVQGQERAPGLVHPRLRHALA
jgi:hypothetical protein